MKSDTTLPKARALRRAVIILLLIFVVRPAAAAQEGDGVSLQEGASRAAAGARKEGRATVRVRVTFADTGKPVRRCLVTLLTDLNHPALRQTLTDRRGEFRFRGVPAGDYLLAADAPGGVSRASGFSLRDTGFGLEGIEKSLGRVTVGEDGEARVEFSVERGGALSGRVTPPANGPSTGSTPSPPPPVEHAPTLSGRVTYSDGEPVAAAHLILYARKGGTLTRFFAPAARTNDRGDYRLEGLPAGEYLVGVVERGAGGGKLLPRTEGSGLASRYHPSAASAREAAAVRVEAGGETEDVDVRLAENELRRLSGMVRWRRNGVPARQATIMLRRRDDPGVEVSFGDFIRNITPTGLDKSALLMRDISLLGMMSSNAPFVEADKEGRWSFEDVPAGVYVLTAIAPLPPEKADKPEGEKEGDKEEGTDGDDSLDLHERPNVQKRVVVTLGSSDINDQRIELTEGGRVSGSVTVDGGGRPSFGVRINAAAPATGVESLIALPAWSKPDGTFLLEAVTPGEVYLDVTLPGGSRHYVRSVTAGGADLLRGPLRIADGAEVSGVLIELGSDVAEVRGRVLDPEDRTPTAGAGVLLFPADEGLWQSKASRVFARADAAGEFYAQAAPGDYLLFAWRPGDDPTGSPESYVRSRAASARRLTLKPGANTKVELTAAPSDKRK